MNGKDGSGEYGEWLGAMGRQLGNKMVRYHEAYRQCIFLGFPDINSSPKVVDRRTVTVGR